MANQLAATTSVSHKPVLVPAWKCHCLHKGCKAVVVGLTEPEVWRALEAHLLESHTWAKVDVSGNYIYGD